MSSEERRSGQEGLTLVGVLVMVAASSIFLAYAAQTWEADLWRDREEELLFRGDQYKMAIEQFYAVHKRLPNKLEELVELEPRSIRRLYTDPMTGEDWRLVHGLGPQGPCNVAAAQQQQQQQQEQGQVEESGPKKSEIEWSNPARSRGQGRGGFICGVVTTSDREKWFHPELSTGGGMSGPDAAGGRAAGMSTGGLQGGFVANVSPPQRRQRPTATPGRQRGRRPGTRGPTGRRPTRPGTSRPPSPRATPRRPNR